MRTLTFLTFLLLVTAQSVSAADSETLVRDTSFLIEESWTPGPGVTRKMSFIDFLDDATDYEYAAEFTVRAAHLVSVTVPVARMRDFSHDPSHDAFGRSVGDLKVSYGVELLGGSRVTLAPSFSVLLPTGDPGEGYGAGERGAQFHIPLSVRLGSRGTSFTDTEATFYRGLTDLRVVQRFSYSASPTVNVQLEALYLTGSSSEEDIYVSPGVRWGHRNATGVGVSPGIALPIELTSGGDPGVLLYLAVSLP